MTDPFMPALKRDMRFSLGEPDADIWIVTDAPSVSGVKEGRLWGGQELSVFERALHGAGLRKDQIYAFPLYRVPKHRNTLWKPKAGGAEAKPLISLQEQEDHANFLADILPFQEEGKIICAMGDLPAYILTGSRTLSQERGYLLPSRFGGENAETLLLQSVSTMTWGNVEWRAYLSCDLLKASGLAKLEPGNRYAPREAHILTDFDQAVSALKEAADWPIISVDIECANYQVSHFGFGPNGGTGYSVKFDRNMWTLQQEVELWKLVAAVMGSPSTKVGQNFIFDVLFMLQQNLIWTRGEICDTMIGHSIQFPDFLKGLGFLASVYINVPSWKNMVRHKGLKEDD